MWSQILLTASVRGTALLPITPANVELGVNAFMKAAFGLRADFFLGAAFLGAAFFAFLGAAFFTAFLRAFLAGFFAAFLAAFFFVAMIFWILILNGFRHYDYQIYSFLHST